jgi:hypothetical protein
MNKGIKYIDKYCIHNCSEIKYRNNNSLIHDLLIDV